MECRVQAVATINFLLAKTIACTDAVAVVNKLATDGCNDAALRDHDCLPGHTGCLVRR